LDLYLNFSPKKKDFKMLRLAIALIIGIASIHSYATTLKEVRYKGFTLWLDCSERLAIMAKYQLTKDTANFQKKS
jgi:hypothetical protein